MAQEPDALNSNQVGKPKVGLNRSDIHPPEDIELGTRIDNGGLDPAAERQQMAEDFKKIKEKIEDSRKARNK